jgi:hypothetical protein
MNTNCKYCGEPVSSERDGAMDSDRNAYHIHCQNEYRTEYDRYLEMTHNRDPELLYASEKWV